MVAAVNGETIIRESLAGRAANAEQLGSQLGVRLRERGAESLLNGINP
jgi:porphobilinogen deaminase